MQLFDLVVVGSGPAGHSAALWAARRGVRVALVEKDALGGVCLNRGCVPTKALLAAAETFSRVAAGAEFGISASGVSFNITQAHQRKDKIISRLSTGLAGSLHQSGVEVIAGEANINPEGKVIVTAPGADPLVLDAPRVLLATGSVPVSLPVPGGDHPEIWNSDQALTMPEIPGSIVIIGAGVIGVEFARLMYAMGVEVTLIEGEESVLPGWDGDISRRLQSLFTRRGVRVITAASVQGIEYQEDGFTVYCRTSSHEELQLSADRVLTAVGRKPWAGNINLEQLGIETNRGIPVTNGNGQTTREGFYVAGDFDGRLMLAHAAAARGERTAAACLGQEIPYREETIPRCIYGSPEIAAVGLGEKEARDMGLPVATVRLPLGGNAFALAAGAEEGLVKMFAAEGRLLGGVIMGPGAVEAIQLLALAVKEQLPLEGLGELVFAHPSLSETLGTAARRLITAMKGA